jgi:hypothetical protein
MPTGWEELEAIDEAVKEGSTAVNLLMKAGKFVTTLVNSEANKEKRKGHEGCTHASIALNAIHYTWRTLFICLSYLDELARTFEWSFILSCPSRCPGALIQYRLVQEGNKVVCKRRDIVRQQEMLVLISLKNLVILQRIKSNETMGRSKMSVPGNGWEPKDFNDFMEDTSKLTTPACLANPTTLNENLTWTWIWQTMSLASTGKERSVTLKKDVYTIDMIAGLVGPIARKFAEVTQRDDLRATGASAIVRARPGLREINIPAYKIGEMNQKRGRKNPRPDVDPGTLSQALEDRISLPRGPEGTNFDPTVYIW